MDNFDMYWFLEQIGVNMDKVHWGNGYDVEDLISAFASAEDESNIPNLDNWSFNYTNDILDHHNNPVTQTRNLHLIQAAPYMYKTLQKLSRSNNGLCIECGKNPHSKNCSIGHTLWLVDNKFRKVEYSED
jgi:hypothetical protein